MKVRILTCCILLLLTCACGDKYAGRFEAHLKTDPDTHQITGMDVITTKNYGNITATGTIDPKTQMPVFTISAENVDATSLAAIVAKSNADIAKSVSAGVVNGAASLVMPGR